LHPKWRQAYELPAAPVLFELEAACLLEQPLPGFAPIPRQQPVWRDLALVAGEAVTHDVLVQAIASAGTPLVRSVRLFDVYRPKTVGADLAPGERSLAVRLELRDDDANLSEERIEPVIAGVLDALKRQYGVRLRGMD
jgi:phenylalanyl-tRNA synthetase beta chain